ncbi:hypothetical protein PTD2_04886 [Pseudoalteromonas tunicata D2]|uniref:Uncharacterized protein n=1 Tax=Pseudoalteromonas tunicata D2 TaxID=87626 RepID=A4CFW4_9GAMM|nr:hypothetical protein PTD2_04886 [Pseudoalteromonas tunicata D2]
MPINPLFLTQFVRILFTFALALKTKTQSKLWVFFTAFKLQGIKP